MSIAHLVSKYKLFLGASILIALAAAPSVYYFQQYQKAQLRINNPSLAAKQDAKDTITLVSRLMMLPEGEEPTVMQITDVTKLKDQTFFATAQNGDKVLIYTTAKKAILYRSETNKIIDVAPISVGATPSATPLTASVSATPKLASPSSVKK